ncbi:alpha/beta hydrolase [Paraburkholderia sp. SARCC-3016]|uniref:alpha/beta fold hydrolase n=1 Tax=Paraburkholderia sp. SARCC-3016 TaxID=3058611 RepID=UPI002808BCC9|nr:alpha/beta hydrolase [Paraburkholderia sp. SARCC-3016]MDQ7982306.1 alpha/beta hydrolase [Paraburkholderia sp. SARCC-3016]
MLTQFDFDFEAHKINAFEGGSFTKPPLLLMHGVGPGASIMNAFCPLLPFLNEHFHVFAMDWIGFGGSDRKREKPFADFSFWVRQARALMARMPGEKVYVFGHSMSAAVALRLAATDPRVAAVFTTGAAGTTFELNDHLKRLWTFPKTEEELKAGLASLIHDVRAIPDEQIESRWKTLSEGDYGDYFTQMLSTPAQLIRDWTLSDGELAAIKVPCTLLHGRNDMACPPDATSATLARKIAHSNLIVVDACAHAPSVEQTAKVRAALHLAFDGVIGV